MVVDNIVAGVIRKEKISVSEIEDAIQSSDKGSIGLINSIAKLFVEDKITLDQAKSQVEEKNIETLYVLKRLVSIYQVNFIII